MSPNETPPFIVPVNRACTDSQRLDENGKCIDIENLQLPSDCSDFTTFNGACAPAFSTPPCPLGTRTVVSGQCVPVGIPADRCGAWGKSDGKGSCELLVPLDCPTGQVAVPGDSACRPISDCKPMEYQGDSVVYVNSKYEGVDSDGSYARPHKTIDAAVGAFKETPFSEDLRLRLFPGTYEASLYSSNYLDIAGTCSDEVILVPKLDWQGKPQTVLRTSGRLFLRKLKVEGNLSIDGLAEIDKIWVEGSIWANKAKVILQSSLVSGFDPYGIGLSSSLFSLTDSVVGPAKAPADEYDFRRAIELNPGSISEVHVRNSVIVGAFGSGIFADSGQVYMTGSVVADTQPVKQGDYVIQNGIEMWDGILTISQSYLQNSYSTLDLLGGAAQVRESVLRHLGGPNPHGILEDSIVSLGGLLKPTSLLLRDSSVEGNASIGIDARDRSSLFLRSSQVRDAEESIYGKRASISLKESSIVGSSIWPGITLWGASMSVTESSIFLSTPAEPKKHGAMSVERGSSLVVDYSTLDLESAAAIVFESSVGSIQRSLIGNLWARPNYHGQGIVLQGEASRSSLALSESRVVGYAGASISAEKSDLSLRSSLVLDSYPSEPGANNGVAVAVLKGAVATLTDSRLSNSRGPAILASDGQALVDKVQIQCSFAADFAGKLITTENLNFVCNCGSSVHSCKKGELVALPTAGPMYDPLAEDWFDW